MAAKSVKYKVTLQYDGSRFDGWQKQKHRRTIQGTLIDVAREVFASDAVDVQGAGRTDKGVHALRQTAHIEAPSTIPSDILLYKLNDLLPSPIVVLDVVKASASFHARHNAVRRSYVYQIAKRKTAFGKDFVYWVKDSLNAEAMKQAAAGFLGMHDYSSFANKADIKDAQSASVLVEAVEVVEYQDCILFRFAASHFLWKMVRRMTGVLMEVGRGKLDGAFIQKALRLHTQEPALYTAPPSGLFLEKVWYSAQEPYPDLVPISLIG